MPRGSAVPVSALTAKPLSAGIMETDLTQFPSGGFLAAATGKDQTNAFMPNSRKQEFSVTREEFPALGSLGAKSRSPDDALSSQSPFNLSRSSSIVPDSPNLGASVVAHLPPVPPLPVPGLVPPTAAPADQFGLLGLLAIIRVADADVKALSLGTDLTSLGLNLNTPEKLFPTFASPWLDAPLPAVDPAFQLPACYAVPAMNLTGQRLKQLSEESLFYAFFSMPNDVVQQAAAALLYSREWRFHREQKVWITRAPGMVPTQKNATFERGTYLIFDNVSWRKVPKELTLQYDQLEERKEMPSGL